MAKDIDSLVLDAILQSVPRDDLRYDSMGSGHLSDMPYWQERRFGGPVHSPMVPLDVDLERFLRQPRGGRQ